MKITSSDKSVQNGGSTELHCEQIDANPVVHTFHWYHDNMSLAAMRISVNITHNTYLVNNFSPEKSGDYGCSGSNAVGEGPRENIRILYIGMDYFKQNMCMTAYISLLLYLLFSKYNIQHEPSVCVQNYYTKL